MITAVTAVTRVLITPNRDAAGYADHASDATVSTRKASSDAGTRCRARGGCLAAASVIAPPSRTSAIAPNPHQPRRFRQNWPAKTVKNVRAVYALMRATRRSVMGTRLVGGSVRSLCNTSGGGGDRSSRSLRSGRGYSGVCAGCSTRYQLASGRQQLLRGVCGCRGVPELAGETVRLLCRVCGVQWSSSPLTVRCEGYSVVCSGAWFRMRSPSELPRVREEDLTRYRRVMHRRLRSRRCRGR